MWLLGFLFFLFFFLSALHKHTDLGRRLQLTVQTLGTHSLLLAALLHHSFSRRTLQAAFSTFGVLAGITGELHRPLRLGRRAQRHLAHGNSSTHTHTHIQLITVVPIAARCPLNLPSGSIVDHVVTRWTRQWSKRP